MSNTDLIVFVLSVLALLVELLHFTHTYKLCTMMLHLSQWAGCFACCSLANSETCVTSGTALVNICGVSIWCVVNGAGRHNFSYDMVVHFWL